jgi:hypothetical protein
MGFRAFCKKEPYRAIGLFVDHAGEKGLGASVSSILVLGLVQKVALLGVEIRFPCTHHV